MKSFEFFVKYCNAFVYILVLPQLLHSSFGKIKEMSTDTGNYLIENKLRGTQVILVYNSRRTPRYLECLQMMSQLRSKMSNKISFQSLDIAMVEMENRGIKAKTLPGIRRNSESLRIPVSDSQIFKRNISISQKLIPIGALSTNNPSEKILPLDFEKLGNSKEQNSKSSFTDKLKNSKFSVAFSDFLWNLSSNKKRKLIPEEKNTRQHCSWILRINSHPIPFNEISYNYQDLLHWLNKRIHRHPHKITSPNEFYSISNKYFAIIYVLHVGNESKKRVKGQIVGDLKALSAEFPYTDFYYTFQPNITNKLNLKKGHSLLLIRQFGDGHKRLSREHKPSYFDMREIILKFHFPFIMLWSRRVLDFILEEKQDTVFLVIRKRENFHLEAAFERVALMYRFPKVKFGVIPIQGDRVSPSKKKILSILGITEHSKLPGVYGLFFQNSGELMSRKGIGNSTQPLEIRDNKGLTPVLKDSGFKTISQEMLDLLNKNSFPKIKVVKCENMSESGLKSFLGSVNDSGGFAHCKQNQFISHKQNRSTITFLNLDSFDSLLERSVHFERIILIYFSSKFEEKTVVTLYSRVIRKMGIKRKSRRSRRRKRNTQNTPQNNKIGFKNHEKQFYLFDKSRNEWPDQLSNIQKREFYLFSIIDGNKDKNVIEFMGFDSLSDLERILSNQDHDLEEKVKKLSSLL